MLTWDNVIAPLAHTAIYSAFQTKMRDVTLEVSLSYSLAAMINLVATLTGKYPRLAIDFTQVVADATDAFEYNIKTSVLGDYYNINTH